jgi:hypothetical protein
MTEAISTGEGIEKKIFFNCFSLLVSSEPPVFTSVTAGLTGAGVSEHDANTRLIAPTQTATLEELIFKDIFYGFGLLKLSDANMKQNLHFQQSIYN